MFRQLKIKNTRKKDIQRKICLHSPLFIYPGPTPPFTPKPESGFIIFLCILEFPSKYKYCCLFSFFKKTQNIYTHNLAYHPSVVAGGFFLISTLPVSSFFLGATEKSIISRYQNVLINPLLVDIWIVSNFCWCKQCCNE